MIEINNTTKHKINLKKTTALTEGFLQTFKKKSFSVSIAVIGSSKMRRLNNDYRGIDRTTDVLSFEGDAADKLAGRLQRIGRPGCQIQ